MLDKLTNDRIKEYKESFEIYDKKKDGTILLHDYENVLKLLKLNVDEFQQIIQEHNLKGEITINFENFITDINSLKNEEDLIVEEKEEEENKDILINAFKGFEDEQEGRISIDDFKEILKSDEEHSTSKEEIEFLISQFAKDGFINYNEFIDALLKK